MRILIFLCLYYFLFSTTNCQDDDLTFGGGGEEPKEPETEMISTVAPKRQDDSRKSSSYNISITTTPEKWKLGAPFSMRCFITPDGIFQYRWFKNKVPISTNQTIYFEPFTREHAGNYTCKVTVKMIFGDYELEAYNSQFLPTLQEGDKETIGIINNYDKYGYIIYRINSPTPTKEDSFSFTFQTYMSTGTLFSILRLDGKYLTIKMEKGKVILDINGNQYKTKEIFNNGQYHYFNFERRENSGNVFINKINQQFTNMEFSNLMDNKNQEITYKTLIIGANNDEKDIFKGGLWGFNWNGKNIMQEVKEGGGERKGEVSIISKQTRISRPIYGILPQKNTKGGFITWDTSSMQSTNKDEIEVSMQPYSLDDSIIRFELDSGNYYEIKMKSGQLFLVDNKNAMKLIFDEKVTIGNLYQIIIERDRDNIVFIINGQRKTFKFINRMDSDGYMRYKRIILGSDLLLKKFFQGAVGGLKLNGVEMIDIGNGKLVANVEKIGNVDIIQMPVRNLTTNYFESIGIINNYDKYGYIIYPINSPTPIKEDSFSFTFQTYMSTGTLFSILTLDRKYLAIKMEKGKVILDINGNQYKTKEIFNNGQYHYFNFERKENSGNVFINKINQQFTNMDFSNLMDNKNQEITYKTIIIGANNVEKNIFKGGLWGFNWNGKNIMQEVKEGGGERKGEVSIISKQTRISRPIYGILPQRNTKGGFITWDTSSMQSTNKDEIEVSMQPYSLDDSIIRFELDSGNYYEIKMKGGQLFLVDNKNAMKLIFDEKVTIGNLYQIIIERDRDNIVFIINGQRKTFKFINRMDSDGYMRYKRIILGSDLSLKKFFRGAVGGLKLNGVEMIDIGNGMLVPNVEKIGNVDVIQMPLQNLTTNYFAQDDSQKSSSYNIDIATTPKKWKLEAPFSMRCFIIPDGAYQYRWFKNNVPISSNQTLSFKPFTREHAGNYTCKVTVKMSFGDYELEAFNSQFFPPSQAGDKETVGIINNYDKYGYLLYRIDSPTLTKEDYISVTFQTYMSTGTLFSMVTLEGKYLTIKMEKGKLILDINGNQYETQDYFNNGQYNYFNLDRVGNSVNVFINKINQNFTNIDFSNLSNKKNEEITFKTLIIGANHSEKNVFKGGLWGFNWNGKYIIQEVKDGGGERKGEVSITSKQTRITRPIYGILPQRNTKGGFITWDTSSMQSTNKDEIEVSMQPYSLDDSIIRFELDSGNYYEIKMKGGQLFLVDNKNAMKLIFDEKVTIGNFYQIIIERDRDNIVFIINGQRKTFKFINRMDSDGYMRYKRIILGSDLSLKKFFQGAVGGLKLNGVEMINIDNGILVENVEKIGNFDIIQMPLQNLTTNYFETHGLINEFDKNGYAMYIIKSPQPTIEDSISFGFKTFVMTSTLVTFVTENDQYIALKMDNGKLILDLNGNQYETQRIMNDGKYYNVKLQRLRNTIYLTFNGTHQDLKNIDMSSLIKPPNNEITFKKIIIGANEVEKDVFRGAIGGMNWNGKYVLLDKKDGECVIKGDVKMGRIPLLIKKPTNVCQQDYCKNNGYCKEVDYLPYCQCELTQYFGPTCENKTFGIFPQNNSAGGYVIFNVLAPTSTRKDELELLVQSYTTDYPLVRFELDNGKYYEIQGIKGQLFLFDSKNSRRILTGKTLNFGSPYLIKLDRNRDNIVLYINGQKTATSKLINITDTDGFLKVKKIIFGADRPLRKFFKGGLGGIKWNGKNTFDSKGVLSSNVNIKEKVNIISMPITNMTKGMPMKPKKKDHQSRVAEEEFTFGGAAEEEDEEPKIEFNIKNDTILKSEMQYLNISCNASNLNPESYVLQWINSRNDVLSSNNSLYFKSLLKNKEGTYICVIERNKMKFNKSLNLKITIPEISIQILQDESLRIGGKIHRKCSDLGLNKTTVVDVFSYKWVNEQNITVSTTDILKIPINDTTLKGTYECHYTSNDTGKIYKARTIADIKDVRVNYQIKILTNPKELKFSEPFTMECDINPAGEYNYVWFKNNRTISSNRTIYFQSFKTEHSGNYRCQATIPLKPGFLTLEAESSQQFTAIRHRQIDLYDKPGPTFFVHDGETKEVHCEGTFTKGGKEVDWLINGKIFRVGDIPNIKRSNRRSASILIIRDISPENDGKYECRFGQKIKEVNIIVLLQKAIIRTSPPILTIKEGELAEFHCYVDNIPSFKNINLKWQFLGKNDTLKYSLSERWKVINDNITTKTSFIELNDAQNRDNGFVICTEPNGEIAQSELVVIPNEKNIITITPKEIKVRPGQKFDIECFSKNKREKLSGEPIFTFSNNQTIVNDPRFVIIKIENSHIRLTAPNGLLLSEDNMEIFCSAGDSRQFSKIFIRELCPSGHRYCQNSQCLENAKFCDGKFDCSDNSDEDPSVCTSCDPVSKKCEAFRGNNASKNYYLIHWACDGEDDCGNAFDENNCGDGFLNTCGGKYFTCSGGKQIPRGYVCDENVDCINGDDETGCNYPSITNTSTYSVKATRTQTITMSCEAVGKPIPTIIWRYNWGCINKLGRITIRSYSPNCTSITSTLTIENFQPGDDGIYNCEALSSRHRAFSKDFQVVLQI